MDVHNVLVTGSDGLVGRAVVLDLRSRGYQVTSVDKNPRNRDTKTIECEDLSQVIKVMETIDAVIHLAAIPSPHGYPPEVVFRNNVMSTFNILEAAASLGINNVVMASSISTLGTAFRHRDFNPLRIPIDETHPLLAQDAYGISKIVGEGLSEGYCRRMTHLAVTSLRFSTVIDDGVRERFIKNIQDRRFQNHLAGIFWTYVDVRDAAAACRLAMESNKPGHEAFLIAAPTILLDEPVEELLASHYPGNYPVAVDIRGHASPIDCSKAERLLGWRAVYDWKGSPLLLNRMG